MNRRAFVIVMVVLAEQRSSESRFDPIVQVEEPTCMS